MRPFLTLAFAATWLMASLTPVTAGGSADMLGAPTLHTVTGEETFVALMARYRVGYTELVAANPGIDPWIPEPGTTLDIPTAHLLPTGPRRGIVVNLADQRLYWFPEPPARPASFPIGIGGEGRATPVGETNVAGKREHPIWYPPQSMRDADPSVPGAVLSGPDNPLGDHALDLDWGSYVIHGTNRPAGVGRRVSHGCIRLAPDDIALLFAAVAPGVPVTIVDEPIKLGWSDGDLWLEVHPSQEQADELEERGAFTPAPASGAGKRILAAVATTDRSRLDWPAIQRAITERRGIPVRIMKPVS